MTPSLDTPSGAESGRHMIKGKSYEKNELEKTIHCVHRCKGLRDREFCNVFFRYCGHPGVLWFCDFSQSL